MSIEARLATGLGIALLVLAILATVFGFTEVKFASTSFEQIGTLLLTVALVAVVIERAVEVYVSKRYDPEKIRVRRPLARAEATLAKMERALAEERERRQGSSRAPSPDDEDFLSKLVEDVRIAHLAVDEADERTWLPLSKVRTAKVRAASFLSLGFGALVAVAGIRVLGQFLPMENGRIVGALAAAGLQLDVFRVADTVLTALVLAGGADGIHKMISSFKTFRSSV